MITAIETEGRFGMGSGKEYVPSYQIEYSRNGGLSWHKWKDIRGSNVSIVIITRSVVIMFSITSSSSMASSPASLYQFNLHTKSAARSAMR